MVLAVLALRLFNPAYNLRVHAEALGNLNDLLRVGLRAVDFHAVPHVVDFEHLGVARAASLLYGLENRGHGKKAVLYEVDAPAEAHALGLAAARAVHEAPDEPRVLLHDFHDYGRVCARGRKERLPDGEVGAFELVLHLMGAAIHEVFVGVRIVSLGVLLAVVGAEHVVARAGQAV